MTIREATSADRDAILALRARCFGDVDPEKRDPRFWEWEFSRARMFVGGGFETHIALVPLPIAVDGAVVPGAIAVDAMTDPAARGAGWFTRAVGAALDATRPDFDLAIAYQNRPAVLGAMLRNGWQIRASLPVLVRPSLPFLGRRPIVNVLTRADAPRMAAIAPADGARVARTAEFVTWRYFDNPHWRYRVTGVERGGELLAWLVARRTSLKGFDTFAIVDLAWRDRAAARALLREAVAEARAQRCTLLAALASWNHPAMPLFLRRGFVPGPHRFRLLVHPMRRNDDRLRWQILWGDTDHL